MVMIGPRLQSNVLRLGAEKRVLLHISRYQKYENDWEVPQAITQEGIACALSMLQNNVSRLITKLEKEQKVASKLCHIKGFSRRRRAYFLTEEGKRIADMLDKELREDQIIFEGKECRLIDCISKIALELANLGEKPAHISELIECYLLNGRISAEEIKSYRERLNLTSNKNHEKVSRTEPKETTEPKVPFLGRNREIELIRSSLLDKSVKFVVIKGIAGIGKTSLARKIAEGYKSNFWFSFTQFDTFEDFAREIGKKVGNDSIGTARELAYSMQSVSPLIVLDDFQNAPEKVSSALAILRELEKKSNIIVISRKTPNFYDVRHVVSRVVFEIELSGLDKETSKNIVCIEDAYERTNGHPLYLHLIEKAGGWKNAFTSMADFVNSEIIGRLSKEEMETMQILSLAKRRLSRETLLQLSGSASNINLLISKCLVSEDEQGCCAVEPISEFIEKSMDGKSRLEIHSRIADYILNSDDFSNPKEPAYHLINSNRLGEAVELLYSLGIEEDAMPLLDLLYGKVDAEHEAQIDILKGDIFLKKKEYENARLFYNRAQKATNEKIREDAYFRLGELTLKEKLWKDTVEHHQNALQIARKSKDNNRIARALLNLGNAYAEMEEFEKAREQFQEAENILSAKCEYRGLAALYLSLARIEKEPYEELQKAIKYASLAGYKKCEGAARLHLAHLGNVDEGKKAFEIFRSIGYEDGMVQSSEVIAKLYLQEGKIEEIESFLNTLSISGGLFWRKNSKVSVRISIRIHEILAEWFIDNAKKAHDYAEKGLKFGKSGKLHLLHGKAHAKMGNLEDAKNEFERAYDIFNSERNEEGVIVSLINIALIYKSMGNNDFAKTKINEAMDYAKRTNDVEAQRHLAILLDELA